VKKPPRHLFKKRDARRNHHRYKNSLVFAMVQLAVPSESHKNIDHDSHHDEVVLLPKIIDFSLNLSVYLSQKKRRHCL
jgi:hypothetical protein